MIQLRKHTLMPFEAEATHMANIEARIETVPGDTLLKLKFIPELAESQNLSFAPAPWDGTAPYFCETLWKHTCLEFFLKDPHSPRYWEWNFGMDGHWGAFEFYGERQRLRPNDSWLNCGVRSVKNFHLKPSTFTLDVVLDFSVDSYLSWLLLSGESFLYSLNSILEVKHRDSTLIEKSHWALKHTTQKPDFHTPTNFALWTR